MLVAMVVVTVAALHCCQIRCQWRELMCQIRLRVHHQRRRRNNPRQTPPLAAALTAVVEWLDCQTRRMIVRMELVVAVAVEVVVEVAGRNQTMAVAAAVAADRSRRRIAGRRIRRRCCFP